MAGTTVRVKLEPITERLLQFVEDVASYIDENDIDDDLALIVERTRTDLELIRLERVLDES